MNATEIKAAIAAAGTSQRAIAAFLGVSPGAVSRVVSGNARSKKIEAELEKIVGRKVFPARRRPGPKPTVWNGRVEREAA